MPKGLVSIDETVWARKHNRRPRGLGKWTFAVWHLTTPLANGTPIFTAKGKYHEVKKDLRAHCRQNGYTQAELLA